MDQRPFDIILLGATGFTGQRAARYFKEHAPDTLKIGLAARDPEKLDAIARQTGIPGEHTFIVNTLKREQVDSITKKTRIIVTTVGPFSLYGEEVIASCAENRTHYLDITGEVGFIREMKDKYQDTAKKNGCRFIPFSGFDSVPAELSAWLLSKNSAPSDALFIRSYYSISGGFNGGTIATMMNKFETGEFKKMNNPRLLFSGNCQNISKDGKALHLGYHSGLKRWVIPFIMGSINSKVVYNTAEEFCQSGNPYAGEISYNEFQKLGKWYNFLPFLITTLTLISLTKLGPYAWFRNILKKVMPAPGEGPSEKAIEEGYIKLSAQAFNKHQEKTGEVTLSYPGDPGNKSTVFFLCESALLLAMKEEQLDKEVPRYGFLSPVLAFENFLPSRLQSKGLHLEHSSKD